MWKILGDGEISTPEQIVAFNLKRFRVAAGISQEILAHRAGLHWTYISSVERNQRNVSIRNIFKLAQGLRIDPRQLLTPLPEEES